MRMDFLQGARGEGLNPPSMKTAARERATSQEPQERGSGCRKKGIASEPLSVANRRYKHTVTRAHGFFTGMSVAQAGSGDAVMGSFGQ